MQIDLTRVQTGNAEQINSQSTQLEYWLRQTPEKRFEHLESLRQQQFKNYDPTQRLPRIFEFTAKT